MNKGMTNCGKGFRALSAASALCGALGALGTILWLGPSFGIGWFGTAALVAVVALLLESATFKVGRFLIEGRQEKAACVWAESAGYLEELNAAATGPCRHQFQNNGHLNPKTPWNA